MKRIYWACSGLIGFLVIGALVYGSLSAVPASGVDTMEANFSTQSLAAHATDGAAQYREKLAAAAAIADERNPLRSYVPTPGVAGRLALDNIYAKGLAATPQSATLALDLLRSGRLSPDEKISMAVILYGLYNRENTTGANQDIALELKILASDSNKQIAHNAAVAYAGLEYMPGTEIVLKQALKSGALESESYFRALAHLVTSAPPEKQKEFLAEIRTASNRLASDILADALNTGKEFNAASFLRSSEDMAELLRATEPEFSTSVGLYGLTDALRYRTWIRASATIESQKTGRSVDDIILARLSEQGTDARKVVAYLSSPEAVHLLASAKPDSPVQQLAVIAESYAGQHPNNGHVKEIAQEIRARMNTPPPVIPKPVFTMPVGPVPGPQPILQAPGTVPGQHP
ncbi:hypothetical protein [Variovorax sp. KK3]|uniref:hypothetical protein n=1 Tax=Variovorax sp. KK3 TaxID=1855728 RepID=UPI0011811ED2|nr:hypothetical protein [Variovorax sp. KK3]